MSTDVTYPHIVKEEGHPARLENTPRVRIAQIVMDYMHHGWSPEEMCRQYPYLSLSEAYAAMAYYYDHQVEIDAEIEAEIKETDEVYAKAPPSALAERLRRLRAGA